MRRAHFLRANKGTELPHAVVCVDTETNESAGPDGLRRHHLRFGWASYERTVPAGGWCEPEWFRFTTPAAFWDWLTARTRPKTRTFVFAHNWSFDGPVLGVFDRPQALGWTLTRAVIEGPPVILDFRREGRTVTCLDTLNWWRMPLASIGESVGLPKLSFPSHRATADEWDTYCRRDVEVLRIALHHWWTFLGRYDLGGFASTLAGQALRSYRHRFMDHPILIDDDAQALGLARESYHGGRTECFRLGRIGGPVYCLDVNSMYPAVMRDGEYPAQFLRFVRRATVDELAGWVDRRSVVARVQLRTDRNRFAVVDGGKLVFPVGRFWSVLTTPELSDALEHGEVDAVDSAAVYERAPLFSRFVSELYSLRTDAMARGDGVHSWLLKKLMNSLYGKFAQRGMTWVDAGRAGDGLVRQWQEIDADVGTVTRWRQFGGLLQRGGEETESRESSPAIASTVTALARSRLWRFIEEAGPDECFYCDTDSLYVSRLGFDRLRPFIEPHTLGALKLERVVDWIVIHGPKDYEMPGEKKTKGVRKSAEWVGPSAVVQDQWSGLRGLMRTGDLSAPFIRRQTKVLRREYTKGTVDPRGRVSPLRLDTPDVAR